MLHDINFTAEVDEILDGSGKPIPAALGRGVYRNDTGELISICGPAFEPVQHADVVKPVFEQLDVLGYDLEERAVDAYNLYDLQGKKGAWVNTSTTDNGAVMRTDVILGDFIQPTGSSMYMDKGPDTNFFKISMLNSHNSKYAVKVNTSYLRVLCMNGMTQPHFSAGVYGKHTSGFSVGAMQSKVQNAMEMMGDDADTFGIWARTKINIEQAKVFLKKTIAKLPNKADGTPHFSEPLMEKILKQFKYEDQTVWGLYNAVTAWQTHGEHKASSNPFTTLIGREQKVAAALKSPEFGKLLAA